MRNLLALLLVLIGLPVVLYGVYRALEPLGQMYQGNIEAPLEDHGEDTAKKRILDGVMIASLGAVPLVVGSVLLQGEVTRRGRRMRQ